MCFKLCHDCGEAAPLTCDDVLFNGQFIRATVSWDGPEWDLAVMAAQPWAWNSQITVPAFDWITDAPTFPVDAITIDLHARGIPPNCQSILGGSRWAHALDPSRVIGQSNGNDVYQAIQSWVSVGIAQRTIVTIRHGVRQWLSPEPLSWDAAAGDGPVAPNPNEGDRGFFTGADITQVRTVNGRPFHRPPFDDLIDDAVWESFQPLDGGYAVYSLTPTGIFSAPQFGPTAPSIGIPNPVTNVVLQTESVTE